MFNQANSKDRDTYKLMAIAPNSGIRDYGFGGSFFLAIHFVCFQEFGSHIRMMIFVSEAK